MRAFWASTCSFFIAFVGWFALAPVAVDVMYSIGQCENQLYLDSGDTKATIEHDLTRPAFVAFKSIKTGKPYCVHGAEEDGSDCKEIPDEADIKECEEDASSKQGCLQCI